VINKRQFPLCTVNTEAIQNPLLEKLLKLELKFKKHSITQPHHLGNLDPHPDPHPPLIKIRIRIKMYKLDPELGPHPHQFADAKPKCMEYAPILALFQGVEPLFLKLGSGSGSGSASASG
jgi:hypothetical protein